MSEIRKKYDADFKRNAVLLSEESERKKAEIADNLGIRANTLNRWCREYRNNPTLAFPGHGREAMTADEKRIRELEKKLKDTEMERDILKKAMAIFSRAPK